MDFREWYEQDGCNYMASEASLKSTWITAKESARREIDNLRADNKALRKYIATLMSTMPKIKADAVREFLDSVMGTGQLSGEDMQFLVKFADVYLGGE